MACSTIEKEVYAVMYALRTFCNFVFAAKVIIFFSYHNPLMYLWVFAPKVPS